MSGWELPINHHVDKGLKCPLCKSELVERNGKYGKFLGCPNYPTCKYSCSANKRKRQEHYYESIMPGENELLNG